jgi:hypothetical protein
MSMLVPDGLTNGDTPQLHHIQAVLDRLSPEPTTARNLRWSSVFRISRRRLREGPGVRRRRRRAHPPAHWCAGDEHRHPGRPQPGLEARAGLLRARSTRADVGSAIRLNDVRDWAKVLSVGEQQRIAFARVLLAEPRAVFLDESTSAMDEGLELMLYELIRAELPDAILVTVSHRSTVEQFHGRHLELDGAGE